MTTLTTLNVSPLAFLPASQWYNHRRAYVYGTIMPLVVPLGRIAPFQISIDDSDIGGVNWTLINYNTNAETSINSELLATGYEEITDDGRIIIIYPGSVNLPGINLTEDLYYLRFEDYNGNFIFSEIFVWQENLDNNRKYVKVEWWHGEDFDYPGGTIRYNFPFKMWAYLYTDIGKPERMKKEEVEERDGRKLPLKQISWKVFKFEFRAPEYLIDAMDLIWQHDACTVTHMGRVYEVEEFVMETEWLEYGDFAKVSIEFRTDTVVVVNGRSYTDLDYEVEEGGCFVANYEAIAWIDDGSAEFAGNYWTDEFGANHSFENGEYVIVTIGGFDILRQFQASSGTLIPVTMNVLETVHTVHDSRNPFVRGSEYFFKSSGSHLKQEPIVTSETPVGSIYTLVGETFENQLVEVWLRTDDGDVLAGTYFEDDFTGGGISFDASGANAYFVRARTYVCPNLGESEVTLLEGIGSDEIGDTHIVYPDPGPPTPDSPIEDE